MAKVPKKDRHWTNEFALAFERDGSSASPALVPLLNITGSLRSLASNAHAQPTSPSSPTPEFREALRQRLLAAATEPASVASTRLWRVPFLSSPSLGTLGSWRRRLLAAGAGATLTVGAMGGVAAASSAALPGDALYDVKRTVEDVRLSLALTDTAKGQRYLDLADTRLEEVERLLAESGPRPTQPRVVNELDATLGDAVVAAEQGSDLLTRVYQRTHDRASLEVLRDFTEHKRARLASIQSLLPLQLEQRPDELIALLGRIDWKITKLTGGAGDGTTGSGPESPTGAEQGSMSSSGPQVTPGSDPRANPASPVPPGQGLPLPNPGLPNQTPPGGLLHYTTPGDDRSVGVRPPAVPGTDPTFQVTVPPLLPGLPGIGLGLGLGGGNFNPNRSSSGNNK